MFHDLRSFELRAFINLWDLHGVIWELVFMNMTHEFQSFTNTAPRQFGINYPSARQSENLNIIKFKIKTKNILVLWFSWFIQILDIRFVISASILCYVNNFWESFISFRYSPDVDHLLHSVLNFIATIEKVLKRFSPMDTRDLRSSEKKLLRMTIHAYVIYWVSPSRQLRDALV